MLFLVVIDKDPDSAYGVTVPVLPGCTSGGTTLQEALANVREAIELHLEGLLEEGHPWPVERSVEEQTDRKAAAPRRGRVVSVIEIDPARIGGKAQRINITIQERLLDQIDRAAEAEGITRSGFLTQAALEKMNKSRTPAQVLMDSTRKNRGTPAGQALQDFKGTYRRR